MFVFFLVGGGWLLFVGIVSCVVGLCCCGCCVGSGCVWGVFDWFDFCCVCLGDVRFFFGCCCYLVSWVGVLCVCCMLGGVFCRVGLILFGFGVFWGFAFCVVYGFWFCFLFFVGLWFFVVFLFDWVFRLWVGL